MLILFLFLLIIFIAVTFCAAADMDSIKKSEDKYNNGYCKECNIKYEENPKNSKILQCPRCGESVYLEESVYKKYLKKKRIEKYDSEHSQSKPLTIQSINSKTDSKI